MRTIKIARNKITALTVPTRRGHSPLDATPTPHGGEEKHASTTYSERICRDVFHDVGARAYSLEPTPPHHGQGGTRDGASGGPVRPRAGGPLHGLTRPAGSIAEAMDVSCMWSRMPSRLFVSRDAQPIARPCLSRRRRNDH